MSRVAKSASLVLAGILCAAPAQWVGAGAPERGGHGDAANTPRTAEERRKALGLLQEAEAANDAGQTARARELALKARKLYPESKSIATLAASLKIDAQAVAKPSHSLTPEAHKRIIARAHLAAGLSRAQILMERRQYRESVDLLGGVLSAVELFPAPSDVMALAEQARRTLDQYREAVRTGELEPEQAPPLATDVPEAFREPAGDRPASVARSHPRALENAARLAPASAAAAPLWYTRWKSRLSTPISVDYPGVSLEAVANDLEEKTGVAFIFDAPVHRAGIEQRPRIDLRVRGASAESILSLATQICGTEYVLMEKAVVITTMERARAYQARVPEVLAQNWAAAKFLFPDAELRRISRAPHPKSESHPRTLANGSVLSYLRSGDALVADIRLLLKENEERRTMSGERTITSKERSSLVPRSSF